MKEEKQKLIEMWEIGWLNENAKDELIGMLLNPDKRDLEAENKEYLQPTDHDKDRLERSRKRKREEIRAPHEY